MVNDKGFLEVACLVFNFGRNAVKPLTDTIRKHDIERSVPVFNEGSKRKPVQITEYEDETILHFFIVSQEFDIKDSHLQFLLN